MPHLKLSQDLRPVSDLERQAIQDLQKGVDEAERDLAQGRWVEHSDVEAKLKRWAAGEP